MVKYDLLYCPTNHHQKKKKKIVQWGHSTMHDKIDKYPTNIPL